MKELISRTGRVQSWIDDPTGRLPVSCTVFVVDNEMEGPNGSLRLVLFHLGESYHLLTKLSEEEESTKMEQ